MDQDQERGTASHHGSNRSSPPLRFQIDPCPPEQRISRPLQRPDRRPDATPLDQPAPTSSVHSPPVTIRGTLILAACAAARRGLTTASSMTGPVGLGCFALTILIGMATGVFRFGL